MGQQTRKVRRLTVHMNARDRPKTKSRNVRKSNIIRPLSLLSLPEIPLVVQRQMRLDSTTSQPVPVLDFGDKSGLANTFVADQAYNTRLKTISSDDAVKEKRSQSVCGSPWEANNICEAKRYGDHSSNPLNGVSIIIGTYTSYLSKNSTYANNHNSKQHGLFSSPTSYFNPILSAGSYVSPLLTPSSAETYFSSSESSMSSLSPPPQGAAWINDPNDPILVILDQMQRQFSDDVSRILSQAQRRRKSGNTGKGERDRNMLKKPTACQSFANMGNLDELAGAFKSGYRALETDFIRGCTCLGVLDTHDDAFEYVDRSEEGNDDSPNDICIYRDKPNLQSRYGYKSRYGVVAMETVSTVIDLQD